MYILDLVHACGDPAIANLVSIFKTILNFIQLIGPILALLALGINFIKLMASPEDKKLKKTLSNWLISLFMLFFIPMLVNVTMGLLDDSFELTKCWNYAGRNSSNSQIQKTYDDTTGKSSFIGDLDEYAPGDYSSTETSPTP